MVPIEFRFAVSDGEKRAATWKLWAHSLGDRSELYIAYRSLGGELKASLHHSGQ